jgi:hypothetical protein
MKNEKITLKSLVVGLFFLPLSMPISLAHPAVGNWKADQVWAHQPTYLRESAIATAFPSDRTYCPRAGHSRQVGQQSTGNAPRVRLLRSNP